MPGCQPLQILMPDQRLQLGPPLFLYRTCDPAKNQGPALTEGLREEGGPGCTQPLAQPLPRRRSQEQAVQGHAAVSADTPTMSCVPSLENKVFAPAKLEEAPACPWGEGES